MLNIYVGNIPFQTNETEMSDLFSQHGEVSRVSIITDRATGQSRGFCFVEMTDAEHGKAAIAALDGSEFGGRSLKVNEAKPRDDDRGGGGGRYER